MPSLIRVFVVHIKKVWVLSYPLSAQQRFWSDWVDAQADLSLRWAQSFCWFCHEAAHIIINEPDYDKTYTMMCAQWRDGSAYTSVQSEASFSAWRSLESLTTHWGQANAVIKLHRGTDWSESLLKPHIISYVLPCFTSNNVLIFLLADIWRRVGVERATMTRTMRICRWGTSSENRGTVCWTSWQSSMPPVSRDWESWGRCCVIPPSGRPSYWTTNLTIDWPR